MSDDISSDFGKLAHEFAKRPEDPPIPIMWDDGFVRALIAEVSTLRAENERLRSVLEVMVKDGCGCGPPTCIEQGKTDAESCWSCIAARALASEPEGDS